MGVKPSPKPRGKAASASKHGTGTDAPLKADGQDAGPASEPGEAFRQAMGDVPAEGAAPTVREDPSPPPAPRGPRAKARPKRKYTLRAKTQPSEPPKGAGVKVSAAPRGGQQAAGFAVGFTVLHMGLAARVPEMALEAGEAEQLGAALDGVCREFGYKPSAKGAAVLAFAGTALMVYAPKIAAVRARKAAQAPRKAPPKDTPANTVPAQPNPSAVDWETVQLLAGQVPPGQVPPGDGGMH